MYKDILVLLTLISSLAGLTQIQNIPLTGYTTIWKNISVDVLIVPTCCGGISFFYVPDYVVKGQVAVFIGIFENCGNIQENETTRYIVRGPIEETNETVGDWVLFPGQQQLGPGILLDENKYVDVFDYVYHFGLWDSDNLSYGNYTITAISNYTAYGFLGNDTYNFTELNSTYNCTPIDENNRTVCTEYLTSGCTYEDVGNQIEVVTNETAENITIEGMNENTTVYKGNVKLEGTNYNVYTFNMSSCGKYCYVCLSTDENVTSDECQYEGGTFVFGTSGYEVHVQDDGKLVTLNELIVTCTSNYRIYDCYVYAINGTPVNDTALCDIYLSCSGTISVTDTFPIVNITQEIPQPEPEPTPTPTPTPSPTPQPTPGVQPKPGVTVIKVTINPINRTYTGYVGENIPALFNVTNIGTVNVSNITLVPIVLPEWEYGEAYVDFLPVNTTVNRTIFVKPPLTAKPGLYTIPVKAVWNNTTLDWSYFYLQVLPGIKMYEIEILEFPRVLELLELSNITIPILLKNTGRLNLTNISVRFENLDECLSWEFDTNNFLKPNETKSFNIFFKTNKGPRTCKGNLIVSTKEGAYAFAPVTVIIKLAPPLMVLAWPILPLLAFIWTLLLAIVVIIKKRKKKKKKTYLDYILYVMFAVEIILIAYLILWYLGFVPLF